MRAGLGVLGCAELKALFVKRCDTGVLGAL